MLVLVIAAVGLPINDLFRYALLLIAAIVIFTGVISPRLMSWLAAVAIAVLASVVQTLLTADRIEEGHNVFLVGGVGNALVTGLPAEAYRLMAAEFDRAYPPDSRCSPTAGGCWQSQGRPDRAYAFSADGIFDRPMFSRRVADIDFSDPVWLRLGFINEQRYNWYSDTSDVQRNARVRSILQVLHPWQLTMPFFVMYRFPASYAGSALCWRGVALWEGPNEQFSVLRHAASSCRTIEATDTGQRIFGVAIARDSTLAMKLEPTTSMRMRQFLTPVIAAIGVTCVLILLVRWQARRLVLPFLLMGLSLLVVLLNDASFIGGVRPFDAGDDGLFYDGVGRNILQYALHGDFSLALEGGEKVFYYGGPGLRYFRALEHLIFGESYLGYLSLMLALPFLVLAIFQRFLSARAAVALTLIFVAIPVGALFGTTFFHYAKWAARGFADPAAATLFLGGTIVLIGRTSSGPNHGFLTGFAAGLLFALALFIRPNLAPGAAVLLSGAGIAALAQGQIARLAGLCIGFLPVFGMALHNWIFGGVFVLFSSNVRVAANFPTPPSIYVAAAGELLRFDLAGENILQVLRQLAGWLSGSSEIFAAIPLHAVAIAVLIRVGTFGRVYDPWLRLIAGAALALHCVALFYPTSGRYHFLAWFLTLLVCAVWVSQEGFGLLRRWSPRLINWMEHHPARARFARALGQLAAAPGG